jgi:hypothetical protein
MIEDIGTKERRWTFVTLTSVKERESKWRLVQNKSNLLLKSYAKTFTITIRNGKSSSKGWGVRLKVTLKLGFVESHFKDKWNFFEMVKGIKLN